MDMTDSRNGVVGVPTVSGTRKHHPTHGAFGVTDDLRCTFSEWMEDSVAIH